MMKIRLTSMLWLLVLNIAPTVVNGRRQCFDSCFKECNSEEDDFCMSNKCAGAIGTVEAVSNLAFIGLVCSNPDDSCMLREVTLDLNGQEKTVTLPGGCLLEHEERSSNTGIYLFELGEELFTCNGDFCNEPPLSRCSSLVAATRGFGSHFDRLSLCAIRRSDDFAEILDQNLVREDRGFCLNEGFTGVSINSNCVFSSEVICSQEDVEVKEIKSCEECEDDPTCDPDLPVDNIITHAPTTSPSISPTTSPSLSPTENPTVSPSSSPITSPTASPSSSPTASPTILANAPTTSPSESPIKTTNSPSTSPTEATASPTKKPTILPTTAPTTISTDQPTTATNPAEESSGNFITDPKLWIGPAIAAVVIVLMLVVLLKGSNTTLISIYSGSEARRKMEARMESSNTLHAGYVSGNDASLPSIFGKSVRRRSVDSESDGTASVESGLL